MIPIILIDLTFAWDLITFAINNMVYEHFVSYLLDGRRIYTSKMAPSDVKSNNEFFKQL